MTTTRAYASKRKAWVFTINNPVGPHTEYIDTLRAKEHISYCVLQLEKGAQGTPHYQGYIEFTVRKRMDTAKKYFLPYKPHMEPRRGTASQAREYCMKEEGRLEGPWEIGTYNPPQQGKRNDLESVYEMIKTGSKLAEICDAQPATYMRYYKAINHVRSLGALEKPTQRNVCVELYIGKPGTGKTRYAYQQYPELYAKPLGKNLWFDGYTGENCVLFDDFSGQTALVDLLRLLDRYPVQVEIKGSHIWLQATRIIITTNLHPKTWYDYNNRADLYTALMRRIHIIRHFHEDKMDLVEHDNFDHVNESRNWLAAESYDLNDLFELDSAPDFRRFIAVPLTNVQELFDAESSPERSGSQQRPIVIEDDETQRDERSVSTTVEYPSPTPSTDAEASESN